MKKLKVWQIVTLAIVGVFALIVLLSSLYKVQPNQVAIVTRFNKIYAVESNPGLHVRAPFIDRARKIYTGDILYDISPSDVITKDKKSMIADNYVVWAVTDATKYYQTLGAIRGRAEERIEAAVYNATKTTISSMTQDEIIAARGNTLTNLITEASNSDISQYGVAIEIAEIKALDLPADNREAVYERMKSERNNIAAGYTAKGDAEAQKIRNDTDRQTAITRANANAEAAKIEAEGEAEYMKILSDAYNEPGKAEFYQFIRGLDSLEAMAGSNKTIILDKNSDYAKMLYGMQ